MRFTAQLITYYLLPITYYLSPTTIILSLFNQNTTIKSITFGKIFLYLQCEQFTFYQNNLLKYDIMNIQKIMSSLEAKQPR